MKKLAAILFVLFVSTLIFAQEAVSLTEPDPTQGGDSPHQALQEISLDLFEREGFWNCKISPDFGVITGRLFDGGPFSNLDPEERSQKIALPEAVKDSTNTKVFGLKIEFFRRGVNSFYITASRPIPIEGITKSVSIWAVGRNQNHSLVLLVQDYFGNNFELPFGSLSFSGWKKLNATIPPSSDGVHGIVQQSPYYGDRPGLRIVGFRVDCDPASSFGQYYLYLDDLRAVSDLYGMENRDKDDLSDNW